MSVDLAHHEVFPAKVGKGGIKTAFKIRAFGRIPNYIVHKYKSYLRGLEVFFGGPEP